MILYSPVRCKPNAIIISGMKAAGRYDSGERQAGKFAATVKFRAVEELSEPGPVYGVRIIKND